MKSLHQPDLYGWAGFDAARNVDFNGVLWVRPQGNVLIDPMPLSDHDSAHLTSLGGAAWIVITNSDHTRGAQALAKELGAKLAGPAGERENFPFECDVWLGDGDELVPGLRAIALEGSKTPGELALLLRGDTLITGDLVRAHRAGSLMLLPDPKLSDRAAAIESVRRLAALQGVEAVLVGDGWPVFRQGAALLGELLGELDG